MNFEIVKVVSRVEVVSPFEWQGCFCMAHLLKEICVLTLIKAYMRYRINHSFAQKPSSVLFVDENYNFQSLKLIKTFNLL